MKSIGWSWWSEFWPTNRILARLSCLKREQLGKTIFIDQLLFYATQKWSRRSEISFLTKIIYQNPAINSKAQAAASRFALHCQLTIKDKLLKVRKHLFGIINSSKKWTKDLWCFVRFLEELRIQKFFFRYLLTFKWEAFLKPISI